MFNVQKIKKNLFFKVYFVYRPSIYVAINDNEILINRGVALIKLIIKMDLNNSSIFYVFINLYDILI